MGQDQRRRPAGLYRLRDPGGWAATALPKSHSARSAPFSAEPPLCLWRSAYSDPVLSHMEAGYPHTSTGAAWAVASVLLAMCLLAALAALLLLASSAPLQNTLAARARSLAAAAKQVTTAEKLRRMGTMVGGRRLACCLQLNNVTGEAGPSACSLSRKSMLWSADAAHSFLQLQEEPARAGRHVFQPLPQGGQGMGMGHTLQGCAGQLRLEPADM